MRKRKRLWRTSWRKRRIPGKRRSLRSTSGGKGKGRNGRNSWEPSQQQEEKQTQPKPAENKSNQVSTVSTLAQPPPNKPGWNCRFCGGQSFHPINVCSSFLAADVAYCINMLKAGGYCFNCFTRGHKSVDCDNQHVRCDKCHLPHQTLLHRNKEA